MVTKIDNLPEADRFRFDWSRLPAITSELLGTGGEIRSKLEDFVVTEIPAYLPCGEGQHIFAFVEKQGRTTRDLVSALKRTGVLENDIGYAGQKDKYSVTRQWLSVHEQSESAIGVLDELEGVRVLEVSRHQNKLRIGHLKGNRFEIRVRKPVNNWSDHADRIVQNLKTFGMPNYFGPQRFGRFNSNAFDGMQLVRGKSVPGDRRMRKFFLSALQSHIFNTILKLRIEAGLFNSVVLGDMAQKHDTGGKFFVEDASAEAPRAERFEISATIPLVGQKIGLSDGAAGEFEQKVFDYLGLNVEELKKVRGDRRVSRVPADELDVVPADDGYIARFTLPKGSYATCLMRELMKADIDADKGSSE